MHPLNEVAPLPIPASENSTYLDQFPPKENLQSVDPDNPVWGSGGAFLIWIGSILVQAVPLVFLVPFALSRGLSLASPEVLFLQVLSILPTQILTLAMIWAFVTRFGKRPFLASLGWGWAGRLRLWLSVGLGVALFAAATALVQLFGPQKPTPLEQLINSSMGARYVIAALAVFTAPFVEEFLYRGVVYSALQRTIGVKGAVTFVVCLFTLIHVPQYWPSLGVISAVALLSFVLTIVRARSGRLLPCIAIHMAFNAVQALLLLVEPYMQRFLPTPEPAVPTVSILFPLIQLIF